MPDPMHSEATESSWQDTWLGRRGIRIIVWKLRPLRSWRFYLRRPMHNCEYLNELLIGPISVTWVNKRWR